MDAFESIVAMFLEQKGYWVLKSVKIDLTPSEKESVGSKFIPTPEVDIVAYKPGGSLILIEVKSFLDSQGVKYNDLIGLASAKNRERYKLLNDDKYRKAIAKKIKHDFEKKGLIPINTRIEFGLAAGKIYPKDEAEIKKYLKKKRYKFYSPKDIREGIEKLGKSVYLNDPVVLTVKLLTKNHSRTEK